MAYKNKKLAKQFLFPFKQKNHLMHDGMEC
jgi:hypothetical protein